MDGAEDLFFQVPVNAVFGSDINPALEFILEKLFQFEKFPAYRPAEFYKQVNIMFGVARVGTQGAEIADAYHIEFGSKCGLQPAQNIDYFS
jgi:hypothetical protein